MAFGHQGLLTQLSNLERASADQPALALAHRALWALFFVIETLPILAKILSSLGAPSAYDALSRSREIQAVNRAKIDEQAALEIDQGKANARVMGEDDMRSHEVALTKEANQQVADRMREVMKRAMDKWIIEDEQAAGPYPEDDDEDSSGEGDVFDGLPDDRSI